MPQYRTGLADAIAGLAADSRRQRTDELTKPALQHVVTNESTSAPPNATWWGPGLLSANTSLSYNSGFITFPANDQFTLPAGLYSMHFLFKTPSGSSDGAGWYLDNATTGARIAAGNKAAGAIWEQSFNVPNYFTPSRATFNLKFYQASGAAQSWKTTATITKWT